MSWGQCALSTTVSHGTSHNKNVSENALILFIHIIILVSVYGITRHVVQESGGSESSHENSEVNHLCKSGRII